MENMGFQSKYDQLAFFGDAMSLDLSGPRVYPFDDRDNQFSENIIMDSKGTGIKAVSLDKLIGKNAAPT